MLETIALAQRRFILDSNPRGSFEELLALLLKETESEYGFIGEILRRPDGTPYLKAHAITNIAWDDATRDFYEKNAPTGLEFSNLATLFGAVITTGKPVIANTPAADPRSGGLPPGHPPLNAFMGLPLHQGSSLVGMIGIANRPDGYNEALAATLSPLMATCATLLTGYREHKRRREAEERLHAVFQALPDLAFVIDERGRLVEFLGGPRELLHTTPESNIGRILVEFLPRDVAELILKAVRDAIALGQSSVIEYALQVTAGQRWFEGRASNLPAALGGRRQAVYVARDISERKLSEQAARESLERSRELLEASLLGTAFYTPDGVIVDANDAFLKLFGHSREDLAARRLSWHFMTPQDRSELVHQCLRDVEVSGRSIPSETEFFHKNGRRLPVLFGASRPRDAGHPHMAFVADITERKNLEEQLRQSQKMEAIGRLAGGIAHDFNNLLVVVTGYAEILKVMLKDEDMRSKAEQIGLAASRASDLTRQLLAYSRKQVLQPRIISLSRTVESMHRMLERLLGEDVRFIRVLNAAGSVKVDPGQIEQVIMNLAVNARDAMPTGGTLTIETLDVELDETYIRRHGETCTPGPYVMLAISDTGVGMDREVVERAFEPFFTTKEKGKGTGLGLSTVYGIVKQSGGSIFVYSERNKGTSFKVYMPRVKANNAVESEAVEQPLAAQDSRETILVVEDEEAVRRIICEILRSTGYKVLEAGDGDEAERVSNEFVGTIDLVVTDVVMPRRNGVAVARALCERRPNLKVLYVSGYTENAVVHQGVLDPGIRFLQKPFSPNDLIRKVRGVLAANGG